MAKITWEKFKQIEGAMTAIVNHLGKEALVEQYKGRARERMLWDVFHAAHNQLQFDDEHPHFESGVWPRLYPYCPGFYLYSEGVNDDHVWTAVNKIGKSLGL